MQGEVDAITFIIILIMVVGGIGMCVTPFHGHSWWFLPIGILSIIAGFTLAWMTRE